MQMLPCFVGVISARAIEQLHFVRGAGSCLCTMPRHCRGRENEHLLWLQRTLGWRIGLVLDPALHLCGF